MNVIGRTVFAADFNSFDENEVNPFLYYAQKLFATNMKDPRVLLLGKDFVFIIMLLYKFQLSSLILPKSTQSLVEKHSYVEMCFHTLILL